MSAACSGGLFGGFVAVRTEMIRLSVSNQNGAPRLIAAAVSIQPSTLMNHAPTGAVLLQFRWVALEGRIGERVNEFEQPVFAWR